ncbi:MAG: anti-toxin [Alphaproteobacteria bacterium]|nr:anti-toxin [Alphaproteobacteria bacterium]
MFSVKLPAELERRLTDVAAKTNHTTEDCIARALEAYLDDYEDYQPALKRADEKEPNISLADAKTELGIEKD